MNGFKEERLNATDITDIHIEREYELILLEGGVTVDDVPHRYQEEGSTINEARYTGVFKPKPKLQSRLNVNLLHPRAF